MLLVQIVCYGEVVFQMFATRLKRFFGNHSIFGLSTATKLHWTNEELTFARPNLNVSSWSLKMIAE